MIQKCTKRHWISTFTSTWQWYLGNNDRTLYFHIPSNLRASRKWQVLPVAVSVTRHGRRATLLDVRTTSFLNLRSNCNDSHVLAGLCDLCTQDEAFAFYYNNSSSFAYPYPLGEVLGWQLVLASCCTKRPHYRLLHDHNCSRKTRTTISKFYFSEQRK